MYRKMLAQLEALEESIDDLNESKTDLEAYARVMLARALMRARRILNALAADEEAGK
jgi:hypothetical protein